MRWVSARKILGLAVLATLTTATMIAIISLVMTSTGFVQAQSSVRPPAEAVTPSTEVGPGSLPSNVNPAIVPSAEMWRDIRQGVEGRVSIPDKQAGVLVQSEGDNFRALRNGPLSVWGGWLMLGVVVVLALFFTLRGRIRVDHGFCGRTVERFNVLDRFTHWLTAIAFIVLALTGLNMLYGRYLLKPIMGDAAFATMTIWGKYAHNYISFAFMLGLLMMLVLWIRYNFPTWTDVKWLARGGGMFVKGSHPPAYKFNAGQKILYWVVIIGGASISVSGLALMMPFEFHLFAPTFKLLNGLGLSLPTNLTALQETQLSLLWHGIVGLVLIALVIAHIYIGTLGMEGAFSAMSTGQVDENWAREHHALWLQKIEKDKKEPPAQPAPAQPAPPAQPSAAPAE